LAHSDPINSTVAQDVDLIKCLCYYVLLSIIKYCVVNIFKTFFIISKMSLFVNDNRRGHVSFRYCIAAVTHNGNTVGALWHSPCCSCRSKVIPCVSSRAKITGIVTTRIIVTYLAEGISLFLFAEVHLNRECKPSVCQIRSDLTPSGDSPTTGSRPRCVCVYK